MLVIHYEIQDHIKGSAGPGVVARMRAPK